MSDNKLSAIVREAVGAERAAERFYAGLAAETQNPETKAFFEEMVEQEQAHAAWLQEKLESLPEPVGGGGALGDLRQVETMPCWEGAEGMSLREALEMARDAENHATLLYDALGDFYTGETKAFFQKMSRVEAEHARSISRKLEALGTAE